MIRHIVLVHFSAETSQTRIDEIFASLHALKQVIPGIVSISVGRNVSPEGTVPEAEGRSAASRRALILDAFERCILRAGFHRTTMQDVAKEAAMSAGDLYR